MPFIGNQPALSYTSFAKQDFTTSATTSYTLNNSVTNENEIALFINFVRQEPTTAYSASNTTLTLTSATSATDDMYCVFLGKAVQTVNPPNGSVGISQLSATGTKDATTFLRGDNTFASAGSPSILDNGTTTAVEIDSSNELNMLAGNKFVANRLDNTRNISLYNDNTSGYLETSFDPLTIKSASRIGFEANGAERMRIDTSGNVLISKTVNDLGTAGLVLGDLGHVQSTISNSNVIYANRLSTDGDVYRIYQDGGLEGSISVSGSTVSYNGFTGTHWSRFTDNSKPTILRGTVLETLDEMCDWYNLEFDVTDENENTYKEKVPHVLVDGQSVGDTVTYNHNGIDYQATIVKETDIKHMKSKISDTTDAKNVYGVFVAYDLDGEGYNDFYVASVGSFVVRIKQGETVAKGDLLQSNGDGTAKVQTDENVKSSSFAKVLSTTVIETYEDGSFIVPCSLMC